MQVKSIYLSDFRSFKKLNIDLESINILIGENNTGKSSIIKALYLMQEGCDSPLFDIRVGARAFYINFVLTNTSDHPKWKYSTDDKIIRLTIEKISGTTHGYTLKDNDEPLQKNIFSREEPNHFIIPFLSRRKSYGYQDTVNDKNTKSIEPHMGYLAAKLNRISNAAYPFHRQYADACMSILGFLVTAYSSGNGHTVGIFLDNGEALPITQMGEGVANIAALLAELAVAKGKLFLIEEPENDLHPAALKALLDLIIASSEHNQFVISTHSNIVLTHLGSTKNSMIYHIHAKPNILPTESEATLIENTPHARLEVLRSLGYSFSDFDLWDGWLILEESSAERIIRDYLIPWFTPKLTRIRTLAVNGISKIEPTFRDFQRLALFTHLEEAYRDAAWVRADGDDIGKKTIAELKVKFPSWLSDRFATYTHDNFEKYYPENFSDEVTQVLGIVDKQKKREAKRLLLNKVLEWLDEDEERGKVALCESANEIITDLKRIESQLIALRTKT